MKAQDYKDIKITNNGIVKVMANSEVWWSGVDDTSGAPGPVRLIGGNKDAGFFGEVPTSELITGDELAEKIIAGESLPSIGKSQYSNEPWLKFFYKGKIQFVAKKPFRNSFAGFSYGGYGDGIYNKKTIDIKGKTYKVRLMKGKNGDNLSNIINDNSGDVCKDSEWNRLMLPIHVNAPSNWKHPENVASPTENWNIGYTDADLITDKSAGDGYYTFCSDPTRDVVFVRGGDGVSLAYSLGSISTLRRKPYGWRPVLELID